VDPERDEHKPELTGPSVWPIGVAAGIACILVGFVVSWWVVAIGGGIALIFGFLWLRDLAGYRTGVKLPAAPSRTPPAGTKRAPAGPPTHTRSGFLALATLGLGGVIGAAVTVPPVFLALIPPFLKQSKKPVDLGPLSNFPQDTWVITTFLQQPKEGQVSARTAYIRNNGPLKNGAPSFTIISNRCAHLGCPVQPNGLVQLNDKKTTKTTPGEVVHTIPALGVSGFSCPCHGGAYDSEGNRTAGPPVKALDRFEYSIAKGHLILGRNYSVSHVDGVGASAKINAYELYGPGQHVDGWEQIFYPWTPPS
jgi:Rieske Fe-S protein